MERTREKTIATQFGSLKADGCMATGLADTGRLNSKLLMRKSEHKPIDTGESSTDTGIRNS